MKNKIIALFLVVVMATLALASCSQPYDYTDGNLDEYIQVSDGFLKALKEIKIEDADFTTDEATRQNKVTASIYSTLASFAEKNGEKKTDGTINDDDTFYYAYYITYTKDGKTYAYDVDEFMKETASPKKSIKLSAIDVNDEDADALSVAIKKALFSDTVKTYDFNGYSTVTTAKTDINKDKEFATAIVSYTLTTGEGDTKQVQVADAAIINLKPAEGDNSIEAQIAKVLTGKDNKVQIFDKDNYVEVCTGVDGDNKTYDNKFTVTDGETTYTCTNLKVLFAADKAGKEIKVDGIKLDADKSKIDSRHPEGETLKVEKNTEVTYHVYPVYYYEVSSADSAEAIVREALADKVTVNSLDIFADETYKNGDKTVKALVEELVKVYSDNTSTKIAELKKAYDAAAKAVTDAGENATDAQKTAEADAKKAYEDAKNAATNKVKEIVAATKDGAEKTVSQLIVEQYRESVYENLEEAYNEAIIEKVGEAIWKLIDTHAVLKESNRYPAELIEESKAHLYNQYEHDFYTGENETTHTSYYSEYNGDFDAYLVSVTKASSLDGVDAKIEEQAKAFVLPIMKIYAVAKVLEEGSAVLSQQIADNKAVIEDFADHGTRREFETVEFFAKNFYITDEVFEEYKKMVGKNEFESAMNSYGGETNIRIAHQVSNIFDYLLMVDYDEPEAAEGEHVHAEITYKELEGGEKVVPFYNVSYTIKSESNSDK